MTAWKKSSYSGSGNTSDCVEVAGLRGNDIGIRDSKAPEVGHHIIGREALTTFLGRIKAGELDS